MNTDGFRMQARGHESPRTARRRQQFKGSGPYGEGPGLIGTPRRFIDKPDGHAIPRKLGGHGQTDRPRADDKNRLRHDFCPRKKNRPATRAASSGLTPGVFNPFRSGKRRGFQNGIGPANPDRGRQRMMQG